MPKFIPHAAAFFTKAAHYCFKVIRSYLFWLWFIQMERIIANKIVGQNIINIKVWMRFNILRLSIEKTNSTIS